MTELSPTWVVITIGSRQYAINTIYIQSIVELNNVMFKQPHYKNTFIKGSYSIHNANVTILDGRKLISEQTVDEHKMICASKINNIKCKHEAWLDSIEWELILGEKPEKYKDTTDDELKAFIYECDEQYDDKITRLINKMKQPYEIIHSLAERAIKDRQSGGGIAGATSMLRELHRQSENYIVKNLEKIIDLQTSAISELCIVVKTKSTTFGISIDKVEMITEQVEKLSGYEKTWLSAGNVDIKGINYNILNLTKLAKAIK